VPEERLPTFFFLVGKKETIMEQEEMAANYSNEDATKEQPTSQGDNCQNEVLCSICMERFTDSGSHYICCLSCGHVFGYSCITKWLKTRLICPSCNQKVRKKDVRRIYLSHNSVITVQDTLDEVKQQWLREVENKELVTKELQVTRNQLKRLEDSFAYLTQRYYQLLGEYRTLSQSVRHTTPSNTFPLQWVKSLPLNGPRTFVFGKGTSIYCSCKEDSCQEYLQQWSFWSDHQSKSKQPIHESTIRDIRYLESLQSYGLLLTCSNDRTLKVVCPHNMNVVLSYSLENVGWCCDWSMDGLYMACGTKNGKVVVFDIRKTSNCLHSIPLSSGKGIHSICWWKHSHHHSANNTSNSGWLAGGMDGMYYVDMSTTETLESGLLQLTEKDKPVFSTCLEMPLQDSKRSMIVSHRSSCSPTNHVIYDITNDLHCPEKCTHLLGGRNQVILSRTLAVCWKNRHYFFTADETLQGSALVWEWKRTDNHHPQLVGIPETFPIRHACPIYDIRWNGGQVDQIPDQAFMGTLSRNELHIYKW